MADEKKPIFLAIHHHKAMGHLAREHITDIVNFSISKLIKLRLPWLVLGLVGGMFATEIVKFFEDTLQRKLTLAFFIPVIAYMSDAVGTQTETLFIRALSIEKINIRKYLIKEVSIGLVMGIFMGLMMYAYAAFAFDDLSVAAIVGLAMIINATIAVLIATHVPLLLRKFGVDPAVGAGPFTTIVQDILSLLVYFAVAYLIIF